MHCAPRCTSAPNWVHRCTKFNTLVHLFSAVTRMLVTSCFVFKFWTMLFLIKISFPKTLFYAFLVLFRFISFEEPSLSFPKKWNRISEALSILRKAPSENLESIWLHECLTFTLLKNVVRRVTWVHTADIKLLDLVKTVTAYLGNMSITITGETTGEVCEFWTLQNSVKTRTNSWILTSRQHS